MCNMAHLRKRVLEIHQNDLLCSKEKARRIKYILAPHQIPPSSSQNESTEYVQSYHDKETNKLGCKHYARNVMIRADCCQKIFPCRHCHDEDSDHALIRSEIKTMVCMICNSVQPASQDCLHCKTRASEYYCSTCHLWTDAPSYHCDACGLCRAGQRTDFSHCNRCNACIRVDAKDSHPCLDRSLESDCPICIQDLFTSTTPVVIMKCGHAMHKTCCQDYLRSAAYQCPICKKSIRNMTGWFKKLQEILPHQPSAPSSLVFCNDCHQKSHPPHHFLYHQCQACASFNTIVLKASYHNKE